jgi:hypothetical protein
MPATRAHSVTKPKYRMVDWLNVGRTVVFGPILVLVISLFASQLISSSLEILISVAAAIAYILAIVFELQGYLFDASTGRLTYPRFFFRRSIPISDIRNANCQTTHKTETYDPGRIVGDSNPTRVRSITYAVNLSGEFGVRRVTCAGKYKRDQFIQLLQVTNPECRITRWS